MKCYLCSAEMKLFLTKNSFMIYKCPVCLLGRTDLKQNYDDFVEDHYSKAYFTGDPTRSAYVSYKEDRHCIVLNLKKFLSEIRRIKPEGKLLDVGCAMGYFVEAAVKAGYDAHGFDPSTFATEEARKLVGDRISEGTIQSVQYKPKSFDIITMFDVFEHLNDPEKDLEKVYSLLKDDGIIVIATGNTGSLAARLLKRRWTFYIPPQHLFFFNRTNLTTLLERQHFQPFRWFRIGKWLTLRYILHLGRTTGESVLARHLYTVVEKLRIGFLPFYVPMGDNMVVIARKSDS